MNRRLDLGFTEGNDWNWSALVVVVVVATGNDIDRRQVENLVDVGFEVAAGRPI